MNIITVLHIPHSSSYIPEEEREDILLSDKLLADEILKMTDWYTDELFASDVIKYKVVCYPVSRLILDPERFEDDALEIMASRGMGVIYTKTSVGKALRHSVGPNTRKRMLEKYYIPHHENLSQAVSSILSKNGKVLVIDCHSFPSSPLPYELDQDNNRPDVCLGTDSFHTPGWLTESAKKDFKERGFSVDIDRPFSGALVPVECFQKEKAVSGIMIEMNRRLYMDERTGKRLSDFEHVKQAVSCVVSGLNQQYGS
ncbi:MAG: N-formylglutamate amidohydrolase [Planctomycetota bacterium]|nr:N-formylglutamate amidohydrolase [Planctomycetota bacterium]